uniref:Uncharacterized protein n=1 Tax=viral metagenome TaxID=1070528 RepID=A0A6C0KA33_9ZZZZ
MLSLVFGTFMIFAVAQDPSLTPMALTTPGSTNLPSPNTSGLPFISTTPGVATAPSFSTVNIIGAAIGGTLLTASVLGIIIRLRVVQTQLNPHKYKHNKKSKIKINSTYPDITFFNPSENVVLRINSMKRSKFEPVNVNANGLAVEKTVDY